MYNPDDPLTFTPNGIPTSLRTYLQEYALEKLTPATGKHVVIGRTLEYGGRRELRWLFKQYGRKILAEWVSQFGFMNLTPISFNYWHIVLEVDSYHRRDISQSAWHNRLKR